MGLILLFPIYLVYLFIVFEPEVAVRVLVLGIIDGAFYALIAIGFSIIFGVSKMFKLSVGGYFILGAFTARWLFFAFAVDAEEAMNISGFDGIKYKLILSFPLIAFLVFSLIVYQIYGAKVGSMALVTNFSLVFLHSLLLSAGYSTTGVNALIHAMFIQSSSILVILILQYIEMSKKQVRNAYVVWNFILIAFSLYTFSPRSPALYFAILIYSMVFVAGLSMLIDRYLLDKARENPTNILIITFGIALLIQSTLPLISFPENNSFTTFDEAKSRLSLPGLVPKVEFVTILGANIQTLRIVAAIISIIFLGLTFLFINKSNMGTAMRAVSQDADAAWLMGINVRKVYMVSTGIGMSLTALGAILTTTYEAKPGWYVYMGYAPLILAIAVVTLGGLGSIAGTALAGFIIGMAATTVSTQNIELSGVVPLATILFIMLLKPEGLFGVKEDED